MLKPQEMAQELCQISIKKVDNRFVKTLIGGILAGVYIGLGYFGYLNVYGNLIDTEYAYFGKIIGALVFPVGIILVIITGTELFTGNCLVTMGCYTKDYKCSKVVRNLAIVWLGNLIGSVFLAILVFLSDIATDSLINTINSISNQKTNLSISAAFVRGILCNILVSLGVYLSYAAKDVTGKILGSAIPVFLFVLCGFEHSVANMFIFPLSLFYRSGITLGEIIMNLIPVTLGNFIGGGLIVPFAYYLLYIRKHRA